MQLISLEAGRLGSAVLSGTFKSRKADLRTVAKSPVFPSEATNQQIGSLKDELEPTPTGLKLPELLKRNTNCMTEVKSKQV